MIILIAFIVTPIVEIALFIEAGDRFGLWPTLAAVIATAIAGTWLLRRQGFAAWTRATQSLRGNVFPMAEVFTGLCLVAAGALLLTPGFLTDAIGLALFAPPVRRMLARLLAAKFKRSGGAKVWVNGAPVNFTGDNRGAQGKPGAQGTPGANDIIDAEFTEVKSSDPGNTADNPANPDSPWRKDR
jgi:UPF0716 protein FxsA